MEKKTVLTALRIMSLVNGYMCNMSKEKDERFLRQFGIKRLTQDFDSHDNDAYKTTEIGRALLNEFWSGGANATELLFFIEKDGVQLLVTEHAGQWFVGNLVFDLHARELVKVSEEGFFVDLGLPSGKLWATENVKIGTKSHFPFDEAVKLFGEQLPSKEDWKELFDNCKCEWGKERKGYTVTGPNGNSIFLPAAGYRYGVGVSNVGSDGYYWSSSVSNEDSAYSVYFSSGDLDPQDDNDRYDGFSVRLVR